MTMQQNHWPKTQSIESQLECDSYVLRSGQTVTPSWILYRLSARFGLKHQGSSNAQRACGSSGGPMQHRQHSRGAFTGMQLKQRVLGARCSGCVTMGLRYVACDTDRRLFAAMLAAAATQSRPPSSCRYNSRRQKQIVWASTQQPAPDAGAWWDGMNKRSPKGPSPPAVDPVPTTSQGWNELRMGVKGYKDFETVKRTERQRGERLRGRPARWHV
jgi:hypothetical protein